MKGLTVEEKKKLHACACGHLLHTHDSIGCMAGTLDGRPCPCEETLPHTVETTYDAVERLVAARQADTLAQLVQLVEKWRRQNSDSIACGRGLIRVELPWVVGNLEVLLAQAGATR